MRRSSMVPTPHVERSWFRLVFQSNPQANRSVFTTAAACEWLYDCAVDGDCVQVRAVKWDVADDLALTQDVGIELLAQGMLSSRVDVAQLLIPAQDWQHEQVVRITTAVHLSLTRVPRDWWWKAAELLLYTLTTEGPRAFMSKCVLFEEAVKWGSRKNLNQSSQ